MDKAAAPPQSADQWNEWAINSHQWEAGDAPLKSSGSGERLSFFCAAPGAASTGSLRPCSVRHPGERVQGSGVALWGATRWGAGPGHHAQPRWQERASDPPGNLGCAGLLRRRPLVASRESLGGPECFAVPWRPVCKAPLTPLFPAARCRHALLQQP